MNAEHFVSRLELAAQIDTSPWARRHAKVVLSAWGLLAEHIDTVELCVSELVTNAARVTEATPDAPVPRIALTLRRLSTELVVEVADGDHRPPVRKVNVSPQSESGRGLFIVEALSKEWGYFQPPTGGKVVWCVLALE
ncbi:ATP-binding protein [Streptomyces sp. NBC_00996]|uniref:ATP-binding protein n=1 Tax=Streptomyces sp. NBC_00996 TaxID=2903710 RepID=UPI003863BC84|nr:ATP-binding protein [Streptomyces sp. NBC_00996]